MIDAVTRGYAEEYANVHRGLHYLSNLATDKYESVRGKLQRFLNAGMRKRFLYTTGTTMGINLVAYGWAMPRMEAGDEIGAVDHGTPRQYRAVAFLRERQGRGHKMGRNRCRWQP